MSTLVELVGIELSDVQMTRAGLLGRAPQPAA